MLSTLGILIHRQAVPLLTAVMMLLAMMAHAQQAPVRLSKQSAVRLARPAPIQGTHANASTKGKQLSKAHLYSHSTLIAKAPVKRFTLGTSRSVILSHKTSVTASQGSIEFSIDIGSPSIERSRVPVKNTPNGMVFSRVQWPVLSDAMPNGFYLLGATEGREDIPVLNITFAIPDGVTGIAPIVTPISNNALGNISLPPSERNVKGISERVYDAASYSQSVNVSIGKPQTFRSLRTITLQIPLLSKNGRNVTALQKFVAGIRFKGNLSTLQVGAKDPVFAEMNSHLVANASDLARFAIPLHRAKKTALSLRSAASTQSFDSIYNWIDPSAPYVRLAVTRDGLYHVDASQLNFSSQGFTLAQAHWNPANLRCINHGKEIPLWIDTDVNGNIASIEFYGKHLAGFSLPTDSFAITNLGEQVLSEYYNVATDTNVYWLTASVKTGGVPLRYQGIAPAADGIVDSIGTVILHHEQDHNYYDGDGFVDETETKQKTEYVGGERFVWADLAGPLLDSTHSRFSDTFYVAKLGDTVGKYATFKFVFRGTSFDKDVPNTPHRIRILVNGNNVSDGVFFGYSYYRPTFHVPFSQLSNGANVVTVLSLASGATLDASYLDYYEVNLPLPLTPSVDTGITKGQWHFSVDAPGTAYQLAFASGSDPHVYNLTDGTRIVPQSGAFVDAPKSVSPEYAAATLASFLKCDNIQPWNITGRDWSILNPVNGADYLVITHPLFSNTAQKLAARRTAQGMRSKVVTTDEVFNAFDYGSNEPEAIRRFLNYAYTNYSGTPVSFVTLLGDASWDPKFNLSGSDQRSFVPAFGKPVSDFYYTLSEDSNLDSEPLMLIARIPIATSDEAESYVKKLLEYEEDPPAEWNRRFLFVAGGDSGYQHDQFLYQDSSYLNPPPPLGNGQLGLRLPPTNIQGTIISRRNFQGPDATRVGDILDALLVGQSLMYFSGHGATFTSDVLFPDASLLHNKGFYPLFLTLSCATGAFAEPNSLGVNESYVRVPEAGSVQTYGTTGFGEMGYDHDLTTVFFQLLQSYRSSHDTTKPETMNALQMLTAAKLVAAGSASGFGFVGHNARLQYSMLGDAATGFVLRPQPELAVYANEVHAYSGVDTNARNVFSISDSTFTVRALIHNYGYSAETPVIIRITDIGPSGLPFSKDDTLLRLDDSAFVSARFAINSESIGAHTISVVIDPDNHFEEVYRPDDSASVHILINGLSTNPFYPYEGSRQFCDISGSNVHFIVLTPPGATTSDRVELQVDTTQAFSRILLDQRTNIGSTSYVAFDVTIPPASVPLSSVYWWRTRIVRSSGDTTAWQYATFSIAPADRSEFSYSSPEQLASTIISGLSLNNQGMLFLPTQDTIRYEAISHGVNDSGIAFSPYAQIRINDHSAYQFIAPLGVGYSIAQFTKDGSQIERVNEFQIPWDQAYNVSVGDSLGTIFDSVIRSIEPGRRVAIVTVGQPYVAGFIDSVKAELQSLGSLNGLGGLSSQGSYALIGVKGSNPGTAKEMTAAPGTTGARVFDTALTSGTAGVAQTPFTAIAKGYGSLIWKGTPIPGGSDITFSVLGSRRNGSGIDVVDTFKASQSSSFSLSNIDARTYDQLAVRMIFMRSSNSAQSPGLSSIELQYDAAPELYFQTDSISVLPASTIQGTAVVAKYTVATLTCAPADSATVIMLRQYHGKSDTIASHFITSLSGHSTLAFSDTVQTFGEIGPVSLMAVVNPNEGINEQLLVNNTITGTYNVQRDTARPFGEVLFTNPGQQVEQHIPECGYVSKLSGITINLTSTNPVRVTDSSAIHADFLFGGTGSSQYFPVSTKDVPPGWTVQFILPPAPSPLQAQLKIIPGQSFQPGQWFVHAYVKDASGNIDTIEQCFTVSSTNGIEHVMNYPNPFKDKTDFTFVLRSDSPADLKIIVYTIAGRKIRTLIPASLRAGLNIVEWDGRDERGNEVGNGTYLYRVVINGKNPDGSSFSDGITERAVRSR